MKEQLKLNKQGYEEYLQNIKKKEKELADVRMYKGTTAINQGDNWHDNPILYQTEMKEQFLMREIAEMKHKLLSIEIIDKQGDDSLIDIGDVVKIDMIFSSSDHEEYIFKLVAKDPLFDMNGYIEEDIEEVSINSPLGNALYLKKIGDIATYKVEDRTITIELKEKIEAKLDNDGSTLKRSK